MPKVISRGLNIGDDEYSKDENQLFTYHCICGALTLISGTNRGSFLCLCFARKAATHVVHV